MRAEGPRALVGILVASGVEPRVQFGIRVRLFHLVSYHRNHAIHTGISVRADRLRRTRAQATVGVADERVLDALRAEGQISMPTAVLRAETAARRNVRRGQNEINAVR